MKKIIVANWKMNGGVEFLNNYFSGGFTASNQIDTVFCPQFPLLNSFAYYANKYGFFLGAQDCHHEFKGAFTGDVSAELLKEISVNYVILGHSERREYHFEKNEVIAKKFSQAQKFNLTPILCIGESLIDREKGNYRDFLLTQLSNSLPENFTSNFIIAYEPIWSIGTGVIATNDQIIEVFSLIKEFLNNKIGSDVDKIRILYGGSVNDKNVGDLSKIKDLSGYLVGSASLKRDQFSIISNSLL